MTQGFNGNFGNGFNANQPQGQPQAPQNAFGGQPQGGYNGGQQGGYNGGGQGGGRNNNYDPSKDLVLYTTPECAVSGQRGDNKFVVQIRSYNNTAPKIEVMRQTPRQDNPNAFKSFRISFEEWQLIKKYAGEIDQLMNGYQSQMANQQPGQY